MHENVSNTNNKQRVPVPLLLAFAASGFAALVDEVAAARFLAIPLGADAPAVAAVLASLLIGFAIGGAAGGLLLARGAEARRLALITEALLAACALLAPWTLPSIAPLLAAIGGSMPVDSLAWQFLRFFFALAACLPAATLMGATFPIALRLARAAPESPGESAASSVYAANTMGATLGAAAAGFLLLQFLGYTGTFHFAAGANLFSFLLIYQFSRKSSSLDEAPPADGARVPLAIAAATFAAGFFAFALEVLFTRVAIGVFGASTYAFTAVLVAFLAGIALGAPIAKRYESDARRTRTALGIATGSAAVLAIAGLFAFQFYLGIGNALEPANLFPQFRSPWLLPFYQTAVAMLLFLPPTLALGAAFPLAVAAARGSGAGADRAAGAIYAWNTAGSLAGTLCATFVLLPFAGLSAGILAAGAVAVAASAALLWRERRAAAAAIVFVYLLIAGSLQFTARTNDPSQELLYKREGPASTVIVTESTGDDGRRMRSISSNGTVLATEALLDLRLQRLLGHLPALLHPSPRKTLVIGLGSGVTAGALATTPGVERVDIIEIEKYVVDAARLFDRVNGGIVADKSGKVNITIADGRSHLLTTRERYDVITCDPIHPWVAGAGNLYSRDCFEQERARLAPGGLSALWLPLYKLRTDDIRVIAKTFTSVYSNSIVYITGYDAILIGADGPLPRVDAAELRARFLQIEPSLRAVEVRTMEELLSGFAMDDATFRAWAGDASLNTDMNPILEFRAPLLYLTNYATEFLAEVRARVVAPELLFGAAAAIDARQLAAASALRSEAISAFLAHADTEIRRAITDASNALRKNR